MTGPGTGRRGCWGRGWTETRRSCSGEAWGAYGAGWVALCGRGVVLHMWEPSWGRPGAPC